MKQALVKTLFFTFYTLFVLLHGDIDHTVDFNFQKDYSSLDTNYLPHANESQIKDLKKGTYDKEIKTAGVIGLISLFYILLATYFVSSLKGTLGKIEEEVVALEIEKSKLNDSSRVLSTVIEAEDFVVKNDEILIALKKEFESAEINKALNDELTTQLDALTSKANTRSSQMKNEHKKLVDKYHGALKSSGLEIETMNERIKMTTKELDKIKNGMNLENFQRLIKSKQGAFNQAKRLYGKLIKSKSFGEADLNEADPGKPRLEKFEKRLNKFSTEYLQLKTYYKKLVSSPSVSSPRPTSPSLSSPKGFLSKLYSP